MELEANRECLLGGLKVDGIVADSGRDVPGQHVDYTDAGGSKEIKYKTSQVPGPSIIAAKLIR